MRGVPASSTAPRRSTGPVVGKKRSKCCEVVEDAHGAGCQTSNLVLRKTGNLCARDVPVRSPAKSQNAPQGLGDRVSAAWEQCPLCRCPLGTFRIRTKPLPPYRLIFMLPEERRQVKVQPSSPSQSVSGASATGCGFRDRGYGHRNVSNHGGRLRNLGQTKTIRAIKQCLRVKRLPPLEVPFIDPRETGLFSETARIRVRLVQAVTES